MNNRNMILAFALSAIVIFGWQWFVVTPQMQADQAHQALLAKQEKAKPPATVSNTTGPSLSPPGGSSGHMSRDAALKAEGDRVAIDTPMLDGSIALKGAKLDDLRLKKYRETTDPKSPEIVLLAPKSTDYPYYAQFGWIGSAVPNDQTVWTKSAGDVLSPGHTVSLTWNNGHGLVFTRVIGVDSQYMFHVADSVTNSSGSAVSLYPFAYVAREGIPKAPATYSLHLGFIGIANGTEVDANYDSPQCVLGFLFCGSIPPIKFTASNGWLGITDKYWLAAVIPPRNESYNGAYENSDLSNGVKAYQASYRLGAHSVAPGTSITVNHKLFAGAKVVDILRGYENSDGVNQFTNAVDWGWYWFFTRPLFWLLDIFFKYTGNFGIAILLVTVVVRLLFFPLANTQFKSMSKMKRVQPEMERLKKLHADDVQKQQLAIMEMYKREKVNPLAGCVPILLTIPVFFSLYKVLNVTIEMRHAPFFGWIHDLSAPDPTSFINLFGLLPFDPHAVLPGFLAILSIGVLPILMGMTQFVQTKLNPPPPDPAQARMLTFMPLIFTFVFAGLPAGLVIYYFWSNLLTIAQQWYIMHKEGVKVHLFENFRRPPKDKK